MKILTIIGARPQFVKAGVVSKAIQQIPGLEEKIIHTGQHFDANMSDVFFDQLDIAKPNYQLNINSGGHGNMTGRMLIELEQIFLNEKPDYVLVYGDTNSTLAGALAASKLNIPVIHVEAGLRSFNMAMPEEINRICTDHISSILFCPTDTAVNNLKNEGFNNKKVEILRIGDVMLDVALSLKDRAQRPGKLDNATDSDFILVTCHRQENTDNDAKLTDIIKSLNIIHNTIAPVVCPVHPRTLKKMGEFGLKADFITLPPVGYLEMLWLLKYCKLVMTDSGGLQKEAYFMNKYCVTLREQTEWVELVENGFNILVGNKSQQIILGVEKFYNKDFYEGVSLYGDGHSAKNIADFFKEKL